MYVHIYICVYIYVYIDTYRHNPLIPQVHRVMVMLCRDWLRGGLTRYTHIYQFIYIYLFIYLYIYICICIYIYMYVYIYICTYIHICIYIYMYIYIYMCVCVYIYISIYVKICMYRYKHMYIYVCADVYIYIFVTSYPQVHRVMVMPCRDWLRGRSRSLDPRAGAENTGGGNGTLRVHERDDAIEAEVL